MRGDEFYNNAVALSQGNLPAEMRSTVSRAYYGAYHTAVAAIHGIGIRVLQSPSCHETVSRILGSADEIKKVGSKIGSLRTERNHADYQINDPRYEKKAYAILQLRAAQDVINDIATLFPNDPSADLAQKLRKYAAEVLRLDVV